MIIKGQTEYKYHIKKALNKMQNVKKWQYDFILEVIGLFLSIKGRINFLQLGRFGLHQEQRYRGQFEKSFDFMSFNKELILDHGSGHFTIAFDPSYISKSGKSTPGVGYYWSGVASKAKWGLEIGGIAAIDIDNHTSFHIEAVQTPNDLKSLTLLEYYASTIIDRKESLLSISKYVVADAYFSKRSFVAEMCNNDFELVCRLRNDAYLRYEFKGKQKSGRGRPKQYDGKVDFNKLNMKHFCIIEENDENKIYQAKVHSKSLGRFINLVIVYTKRKDKWNHKLYFSTDLNLEATVLLKYYQTRFQIEFTYRDGKQFTGLHDCQARSENKLHFHFNAALTGINIAKVEHWLSLPKSERGAFSMNDIKTINNNMLQLQRFFDKFGINSHSTKNKLKAKELIYYGTIAA